MWLFHLPKIFLLSLFFYLSVVAISLCVATARWKYALHEKKIVKNKFFSKPKVACRCLSLWTFYRKQLGFSVKILLIFLWLFLSAVELFLTRTCWYKRIKTCLRWCRHYKGNISYNVSKQSCFFLKVLIDVRRLSTAHPLRLTDFISAKTPHFEMWFLIVALNGLNLENFRTAKCCISKIANLLRAVTCL